MAKTGISHTPWTMEQWVELIDEAEECTPVEIADVVKTCLTDWYCSLSGEERKSDRASPKIDFDYLLSKAGKQYALDYGTMGRAY